MGYKKLLPGKQKRREKKSPMTDSHRRSAALWRAAGRRNVFQAPVYGGHFPIFPISEQPLIPPNQLLRATTIHLDAFQASRCTVVALSRP